MIIHPSKYFIVPTRPHPFYTICPFLQRLSEIVKAIEANLQYFEFANRILHNERNTCNCIVFCSKTFLRSNLKLWKSKKYIFKLNSKTIIAKALIVFVNAPKHICPSPCKTAQKCQIKLCCQSLKSTCVLHGLGGEMLFSSELFAIPSTLFCQPLENKFVTSTYYCFVLIW